MLTAQDIMRTDMITISPDHTLREAVQVLLDHRISGLPVVDGEGRLLGIISEFALLAIAYDPPSRAMPVREHMTRHVISVTPETPITKMADTFILHRIRRLPVVEDAKLLGVVSRRELLGATLDTVEPVCSCFATPASVQDIAT
jgi:CBS domain-containing protein